MEGPMCTGMPSDEARVSPELAAVAFGAASPLLLGLGVAALIPVAMSLFGTRVAGVGTQHASAAAGGITANPQALASALWSFPAVLKCAAVAGIIACYMKYMRTSG